MAASGRAALWGGVIVAAGVAILAAHPVLSNKRPPVAAVAQQRLEANWQQIDRIQKEIDAGRELVAEREEMLSPWQEAERLGLPASTGVLVVREAKRHGLEPALVAAVVDLESGFDPSLTHADADGTFDRGLMQLNDSTSPWLASQVGIPSFDQERDPYDPEENLRMGVWYLSYLLQRYEGDLNLALLAYNAGMGTADRRRREELDSSSAYGRAVERIAVSRGWWRTRVEPTGPATQH